MSDGAGGHGSGDVASKLVVESIIDAFARDPLVDPPHLHKLLLAAQNAVMAAKAINPRAGDMHATCVALMIDREHNRALWGHVGDSRLYLFRNGKLHHQTRDHSLVQNMIDAGYGSNDLSRTHPNRNLLTSAIGNPGELEATMSEDFVALEPNDTFLLCSDGLWEHVMEDYMAQALARSDSLQDWISRMAAKVSQEAGNGHDNYTAIGVSTYAPPSPEQEVSTVSRSVGA